MQTDEREATDDDRPLYTWQLTRQPLPEEIRCDLCGEQADSFHFMPWAGDECQAVVFACPEHCPVPEGYWFDTADWFCEGGEEKWAHHLKTTKGWRGLALLRDRFTAVQRELGAKEAAGQAASTTTNQEA